MPASFQWISSGFSGLDKALDGLRTGDNVFRRNKDEVYKNARIGK